MGVHISGWIEVKRSYSGYEGEWTGIIKIDPLLFDGFKNHDFRASLYSISKRGLPVDASDEVKGDWDPTMHMEPSVLNWDDAWKMDTETANSHWWTLFEMVDALSKLESDFQKLRFRFVHWV